MKIAHIHAYSRNDEKLRFHIDYLDIEREDEETYTVKDEDKGIAPRGNWLSKEINLEAADDGYASLYLPGWVRVDGYETNGVIYALENEIEKGKEILKETFIKKIDSQIQKLNKIRKSINESK